jgi:hypothetical protein
MHAANSVAPEDSEAEDCPLPVEQLFNYHRVKESATYVGLAVLALYAPLGIILGCVRILLLALHLLVLRALPATVSQHSQLYVAGRVRARTPTIHYRGNVTACETGTQVSPFRSLPATRMDTVRSHAPCYPVLTCSVPRDYTLAYASPGG